MSDAIVTWFKTPQGTPTNYLVVWRVNGVDLTPVSVPVTAAQDSSGYSLDFVASVPGVTLKGGDVVGATVQAVDGTHSLSGPITASSPASVTVPQPPPPPAPGAPADVSLALA